MRNLRLIGPRTRLLGVVTVVLLGVVLWQSVALAANQQKNTDRNAPVAVAKAQVLDLTTLDQATVKQKIAAMSGRVTGDFKRQFDQFTTTFVSVVAKDKINATGAVKSAALSSYGSGSATVLVASTATVTTSAAQKAVVRNYRFSVSLSQINGKWLISGMEFVQ